MTLQTCVSYLTENDYLVHVGTRYLLTAKFNLEMTGENIGVEKVLPEQLVVKERMVSPKKPVTLTGGEIKGTDQIDWAGLYQQIIIDAKIPKVAFNNSGDEYEIRKATKPGREGFRRALQTSGVTYDKLKEVLTRYYKTSRQYRVKVETYFTDEHWRTDIEELTTPQTKDDHGSIITQPRFA